MDTKITNQEKYEIDFNKFAEDIKNYEENESRKKLNEIFKKHNYTLSKLENQEDLLLIVSKAKKPEEMINTIDKLFVIFKKYNFKPQKNEISGILIFNNNNDEVNVLTKIENILKEIKEVKEEKIKEIKDINNKISDLETKHIPVNCIIYFFITVFFMTIIIPVIGSIILYIREEKLQKILKEEVEPLKKQKEQIKKNLHLNFTISSLLSRQTIDNKLPLQGFYEAVQGQRDDINNNFTGNEDHDLLRLSIRNSLNEAQKEGAISLSLSYDITDFVNKETDKKKLEEINNTINSCKKIEKNNISDQSQWDEILKSINDKKKIEENNQSIFKENSSSVFKNILNTYNTPISNSEKSSEVISQNTIYEKNNTVEEIVISNNKVQVDIQENINLDKAKNSLDKAKKIINKKSSHKLSDETVTQLAKYLVKLDKDVTKNIQEKWSESNKLFLDLQLISKSQKKAIKNWDLILPNKYR